MSITIKDIARLAGVSYSTVSKALNDSPLVQPKTKEKILSVAKQLGYQPNLAAKRLVSKKSHIIGIAWPTIERQAWSTLVTMINDQLEQLSYHTLLSINPVESAVSIFNRFQVDGILVFREDNTVERSSDILSSPVPLLFYGRTNLSVYPTIDVNRRKAIFLAVQHLAEKGHQKVAYIGDLSQTDITQQEKFVGFSQGVMHFGLATHPDMTINTEGNSPDKGYEAFTRLLNSPFQPTAIVSGSYDITLGILKAVKELGIRIPDELSMVSYDNLPQMASFEPPLTAVGAPVKVIAQQIVETILTMIQDPRELPYFTEIDIELVERESVGTKKA